MKYEATVNVENEVLERVNNLLNISELGIYTEAEKLLNPKIDDFISLVSVSFANGNIIDIDVCSGTGNYYDSCVLKDKNGNEINYFDCNYFIDRRMVFHYENDIYIININTQIH